VADGTYTPDQGPGITQGDQGASFALRNNVALYGGFAGGEANRDQRDPANNETILSGDLGNNDPTVTDNAYHVVTAGSETDATAVLDGFTITAGNGCDDGAGVWCNAGSPTISRCIIRGNQALTGGAIRCEDAAPLIAYCTITNNSAFAGGGVFCFGSSGTGPVRIHNCLFSGNHTATVCGEDAYCGGAIGCVGAQVDIANCTFADNAATVGPAIACPSGYAASTVGISNSILWDAGDEISNGNDSTITVTYSDVQGATGLEDWFGQGCIAADPIFADAPNGDYRLTADSPCIDAGDNAAVPAGVTTDLDLNPRFVDDPATDDTGSGTPPIVDMGAYEFRLCHCPPSDVDGDGDVDLVDFQTFQACYAGPNRPYNSQDLQCFCLDDDHDGDVDLVDFLVFQDCYNGPNQPPGCDLTGCGGVLRSAALPGGSSQSSTPPTPPYEGGEVVFDLRSPAAGQRIARGTPVPWRVDTTINGTSPGVAGYVFDLELRREDATGGLVTATIAPPETLHPLSDESAVWRVYGPNAKTPGRLVGVGDAFAVPWLARFNEFLTAMASRSSQSSTPPAPPYEGGEPTPLAPCYEEGEAAVAGAVSLGVTVSAGSIDTSALAPGRYVLLMRPTGAAVLRTDVALNTDLAGNFAVTARAVTGVGAIAFEIAK
jgi:hypothetical protein